jgi:hypothetical protein
MQAHISFRIMPGLSEMLAESNVSVLGVVHELPALSAASFTKIMKQSHDL